MKKKVKAQDFIKKHEYPGGKKAMDAFIIENMQYPKEALELKQEAEVWVEYEMDFSGKVAWAKSVKPVGLGFDEEAVRLVRLLKFAPQNNHGIKISSKQKIKIRFRLPLKQQEIKLNYAYTQNKQEKNKNPETSKTSYSYTINLK